MATEFVMPKLGLTMEQGTIVEWLVADGDMVESGAAVLRIETDKTETEVAATATGRLQVVGRPGDTFDCGQRIGWLLAPGEETPVSVAAQTGAPTPTPASVAASTAPSRDAASAASGAATSGGRIIASPLAKRLAAERGLDLGAARGTGPQGRIVAADVADLPARGGAIL